MRQGRDGLALHGNAVLVNFTVECLVKDDFILEGFVRRYMGFVAIVEPKVHAIEKVKASHVDDCRFFRSLIGAEENRSGKDSLESLDHAAIVGAVLGQAKEFKDLGGRLKMDGTGVLFHRESSDPDGNQTVLAVRQAASGMSGDFERKSAVTPCVNELAARRPAQGNAAEDEGPGIETQVLSAELAVLADEMDGFELLEAAASDPDGRQRVSDASEPRIRLGAGHCLAFCSRSQRSVREIGQEEPSNDRIVENRVLAPNREQNRNIGPKLLNCGTFERSPAYKTREQGSRTAGLVRVPATRQVFGNSENPLNVRKREEASHAVAGHLGVFASLETPADRVGMDSQERAEIPGPIVVFLGES